MGGFNPIDQLERYLRWYRTGYLSSTGYIFDIGNTIAQALHYFERSREPYPGSDDMYSSGNGSLMRLAAVPMFYAHRPILAVENCANSSRTTHASPLAVDACRYYGVLILRALNGISKIELLTPPSQWNDVGNDVQEIVTNLEAPIRAVAEGSFRKKMPPEIRGTGFVVESMESALWAFHHTGNFKDGALMSANLGDDADTTAAIYGQLAGAYYGEEGIPAEWRSKLALLNVIVGYADRLYDHSV